MKHWISPILLAVLTAAAVAAMPSVANAQLTANFRLDLLDYNGGAADCDVCVWPCSLPTCELYWIAGVQSGGVVSPLVSHPGTCPDMTYHSMDDGIWDFTNVTVQRSLANMSASAEFTVSLYDEDGGINIGDDDLLGSHTFVRSTPVTDQTGWNNDTLPSGFSPSVCGTSVSDDSKASRFNLQYDVWFTDSSAPSAPGRPTHSDDSPVGWDDDTTLSYAFTASSDPNSGISDYRVELEDNVNGQLFLGLVGSTSPEFTVCASGCTINVPVVDGRSYRARAWAANGASSVVTISRTFSAGSPWSAWTEVDLRNPSVSITGPTMGSWHGSDFNVSVSDSDANAMTCEVAATSGGAPGSGDWRIRTCDSDVAITVGPDAGDDCHVEGSHTSDPCWVYVMTTDAAGRKSQSWTEFSIDYTGEAVTSLTARETSSGSSSAVPNPGGWTQDLDPYFTWGVSVTDVMSPVARWFYAMDQTANCSTSTSMAASGNTGTLQHAAVSESATPHAFTVRALDTAGNCGVARTLTFGVDRSPDNMNSLSHAAEGTWVSTIPTVTWSDTVANYAPIVGYTFGTTPPGASCSGPVVALSNTPTGLSDGVTTFYARPVDAAGVCGNIDSVEIWLDRSGDDVTNLRANGGAIAEGVFQSDATPDMSWSAPVSVSPMAGYIWDVVRGAAPALACGPVATTATHVSLPALPQGASTFRVRAIDAAGNCGATATFEVWVDSLGDAIPSLTALNDAGQDLAEATWQGDSTPSFNWGAPPIDPGTQSPIVGYVTAVDGNVDCGGPLLGGRVFTPTLDDGVHQMAVAAVDAAGNCGPTRRFTVWVDATADLIVGLGAFVQGVPVSPEGAWIAEDPEMRWSESTSSSPIVGYAYGVIPILDCANPHDVNHVQLGALAEGANTFYIRALDAAGNCGPVLSHSINLDSVADSISGLTVLTDAGGTVVAPGAWTNDNTLAFEASASGTAPIAGYSFAVDAAPGCSINHPGAIFAVASGTMSNGPHMLQVRAVDAAGNCGPVSSQAFNVDVDVESVTITSVLTGDGGSAIAEGVWQDDSTPYIAWTTQPSVSPIAGYSVGVGAVTDCTLDTTDTHTTVSLGDGITAVWVRAIDEAGGCGPASMFNVAVDATADEIVGLAASTEEGGTPIAEATWQEDNDPFLDWDDTLSASPIVGYNVGLDVEPTCTATLTTSDFQFPNDSLSNGHHTLYVVAIDEVGNCSAPEGFDIYVLGDGVNLVVSAVDPAVAGAGETVTVTVTADSPFVSAPPTVTVAGVTATRVSEDEVTWTYEYVVTGTEDEGELVIEVTGTDVSNNDLSAEGTLIVDFTPPRLVGELLIAPSLATSGDTVTIGFSASEVLADAMVRVDGNLATLDTVLGLDYVFSYVLTGDEVEGDTPISIDVLDLAGNSATEASGVRTDFTAPAVTISAPSGFVQLLGGQILDVAWTTLDAHVDTATLEISTDGGATFPTTVVSAIADIGSYAWMVNVFGDAVVIRVTATDQVGLQGSATTTTLSSAPSGADSIVIEPETSHAEAGQPAELTLRVINTDRETAGGDWDITLTLDGNADFGTTTLSDVTVEGQLLRGTINGEATVEILDEVAETVGVTPNSADLPATSGHAGATVEFDPGTADHLMVEADDGLAAVGEVESLTVTVVDRFGNSSPADVNLDLRVDGAATFVGGDLDEQSGAGSQRLNGGIGGDGLAVVSVTSEVDEEVTVTATSASLLATVDDEGASVRFFEDMGPDVDPLNTTVEASPDRIPGNGVAIAAVVVTPRTASGEVVGTGLDVEIVADFGNLSAVVDEGDGTYTASLSSGQCRELPAVVSAIVSDVAIAATASVTFTCGGVDSRLSQLIAAPTQVVANGIAASVITVIPLETDGQRVGSGLAVTLETTLGQTTFVVDNGDGTYSANLTSSDVGAATVGATVDGVTLDQTATVEFTTGDGQGDETPAPGAGAGASDSGCGCSTVPSSGSAPWLLSALLLALFVVLRRVA